MVKMTEKEESLVKYCQEEILRHFSSENDYSLRCIINDAVFNCTYMREHIFSLGVIKDILVPFEEKLISLYDKKIEDDMKKLKLSNDEEYLKEDGFILFDSNTMKVVPEKVKSAYSGQPVFSSGVKLVFFKELIMKIQSRNEKLHWPYSDFKTYKENYASLKKRYDAGEFGLVSESEKADYDFEGLTREQMDSKAFSNMAIEQGLVEPVNMKQTAQQLIVYTEELLLYMKLIEDYRKANG